MSEVNRSLCIYVGSKNISVLPRNSIDVCKII